MYTSNIQSTIDDSILPDGYEVELMLNKHYGFRKGGDQFRPFQGKFKTRGDAIHGAIEHSLNFCDQHV